VIGDNINCYRLESTKKGLLFPMSGYCSSSHLGFSGFGGEVFFRGISFLNSLSNVGLNEATFGRTWCNSMAVGEENVVTCQGALSPLRESSAAGSECLGTTAYTGNRDKGNNDEDVVEGSNVKGSGYGVEPPTGTIVET